MNESSAASANTTAKLKREKLVDKTAAKHNPQTIAKLMDEIHRSVVHGNGKCDC